MVGNARPTRVKRCAAELLSGHVLAGCRFHERRATDEDRARAFDDHRLVAHRGDVGAARRARAHDDRDLRNVRGGEPSLVVEDPAEVVSVGEHVGLQRQKRAAGVDEIHAREPVLSRDLLSAKVLLDRQRKVRAAFYGGVVRDDDAQTALDRTDSGHDPRPRCLAVVDVPRRQSVELEKRRAGVDEPVDALACGELATRAMALRRLLTAAGGNERRSLTQLRHEGLHGGTTGGEGLGCLVDRGRQDHRASAYVVTQMASPRARSAAVDDRLLLTQHERVVEYGTITAALALLVSSLSGLAGSIASLPTNDAKATALVTVAAKKQHVGGAAAREAYAKAPYRKPVLRYVYALGWVGSARDRARCAAEQLLGPKPRDAALAAIKERPKLVTRLRAAHVTVSQAATALARGTTDGCA